MMKALKAGLFGLALGALGAVALPTQEAQAQCTPAGCMAGRPCCAQCNPDFQACLIGAGNNTSAIARCVSLRSYCESSCRAC